MLVSRKLLNRYVDIEDIDTQTLADELTDAGLEVEGIETLASGTNLVVGHVLECEKHPDSDNLSVCKVNTGESIEQIVCGASNVAKDQKVVVAKNGAVLPGITIKPTTIRGVESNGMICSLNELGVAEKFISEKDKEGIVVLEEGEIGADALSALGFDDEIIDVSQTPNRSDFLAMFSVAHEVSAIFNRPLTLPKYDGAANIGTKTNLVTNSNSDNCSYFAGKVINQVTIKESPKWIKEALMASGINSINNVVDISNLVMLETGQPMHFYDIEFLNEQNLNVKDDIETTVIALDDKEYKIEKGDMLIMNGETPVGIAGIMGLGNSMIHDKTKGLIIEMASFDMVRVRQTASRLGLSTESSSRYSKPMDNLAPIKAMDRAVSLLIEYADATLIEETVVYGEATYEPIEVSVQFNKINEYLGTSLSEETAMDVLSRLFFNPILKDGMITTSVPSFRKDIKIDVDLIEEVIRLVGYDVLETTLPKLDLTMGALDPRQKVIAQIEKIMLGYGAYQTLSYTLVSKEQTFNGEALDNPIKLLSPMSDKREYLRTHLTPSLLEVASYNRARQTSNALLFEISKIYTNDLTTEKLILLGMGQKPKPNWIKETMKLDFFALKGMFVEMMEQLGFNSRRIDFVNEGFDETYFHPYKAASITLDRKRIGVLGHIHPNVAKKHDLNDTTILEVDLMDILEKKKANIKAENISP
ncbi:MAG TPA: phenylalanine--tRNA ligase subunit beta, partial [Erysipelothrix sp.]|nr:phenylalanine--tRNA ligase subunit beta [Erysipelothrix sp.]